MLAFRAPARSEVRERIAQEVLDHLMAQLRAVTVEDAPFCHFYLRDVFPAHLYPEVLKHLPDHKIYQQLSKRYSRADGTSTRDMLGLNDKGLRPLSNTQREFWGGVNDALTSPELQQLVFDRLSKDLTQRFNMSREELLKMTVYPVASLTRDIGGYRIKVHPDIEEKIATLQFYMPEDDSQIDLGTALYVEKATPLAILPDKWMSDSWRFKKVKQFDFLPNSGYGFAVSDHSWHGRETVPMASGIRHTLMLIFYSVPGKKY